MNSNVKASGSFRRPPRPGFEVVNCDIKTAYSLLLNWNMKSAGKRSAFRRTCSLSRRVSTPGDQYLHRTTDAYRTAIRRKLRAYHVHVQLGCIAQGLLQHLSLHHMAEVWRSFRSWLRTMNPALPPSELIVAHALRSAIPALFSFPKLDPSLKKIIDNYYRYDLDLVSERMAA